MPDKDHVRIGNSVGLGDGCNRGAKTSGDPVERVARLNGVGSVGVADTDRSAATDYFDFRPPTVAPGFSVMGPCHRRDMAVRPGGSVWCDIKPELVGNAVLPNFMCTEFPRVGNDYLLPTLSPFGMGLNTPRYFTSVPHSCDLNFPDVGHPGENGNVELAVINP